MEVQLFATHEYGDDYDYGCRIKEEFKELFPSKGVNDKRFAYIFTNYRTKKEIDILVYASIGQTWEFNNYGKKKRCGLKI